MMTKMDNGLELILILGHEEECRKVWETQVLLPSSLNSKNICFAGSYRPKLDYETISSWFPTYENEHPIIHKDAIRSDCLKKKSGILLILIMASIIVVIYSFMTSMLAFIYSCTSSISLITLALARVR